MSKARMGSEPRSPKAFDPWEFADDFSVNLYRTPEQHLLLSVIENAICDMLIPSRYAMDQHIAEEAYRWLFVSPRPIDKGPCFTFEQACEALGLDSAWMREQISSLSPMAKIKPRRFKFIT